MPLVYRVEDEYGVGPYDGYIYRTGLEFLREHSTQNGHPASKFIRCNYSRDYYCGFKSITQLKKWFNQNERSALHSHGLKLSVYKVSETKYKKDKKQVVFLRSRAKLVDMKSLEEIQ